MEVDGMAPGKTSVLYKQGMGPLPCWRGAYLQNIANLPGYCHASVMQCQCPLKRLFPRQFAAI